MTTEGITLELEPRDVLGKKVKKLRREGIIPVHLYGPGENPRSLQCQSRKLIQVLSAAGGNTAITVSIEGEPGNKLAFAREIQWDPKRDSIFHVDLLVAEVNRPVTAQVPIELIGDSPGARAVSGTIMQQLRQVEVQALPLQMPSQVVIDLALLTEPDGVIRVGDLELPSEVTVLTDAEEVVVRIELPRVEVEGAIEAGAGEEPAAEAEGESPG